MIISKYHDDIRISQHVLTISKNQNRVLKCGHIAMVLKIHALHKLLSYCVLYSRDQVCNYRLHKLKETLNKIHLHSIHLTLQLEKTVKKAIEWCIALHPSVTITWKAIHAGTLDSLTWEKKLDEYRR